jgi:replicative DNA helicase
MQIPIVAFSQLNREVEKRSGKRPMLADLRESGNIEQDADMVAFIYRAEYYGVLADEDGNSTDGAAEIIVAKNRHGAQDTVRLHFRKELIEFTDPVGGVVVREDGTPF